MKTIQLEIVCEKKNIDAKHFSVTLKPKLLGFDEHHRDIAKAQIGTGLPAVDWEIENIAREFGCKSTKDLLEKLGKSKTVKKFMESDSDYRVFLIPGDINLKELGV